MQREIQIPLCLQYAFKLTHIKHIEIIKGLEFPASNLPMCFSSNYASVCPAVIKELRVNFFFTVFELCIFFLSCEKDKRGESLSIEGQDDFDCSLLLQVLDFLVDRLNALESPCT